VPVAEIIEFMEIVRARARRREHVLTERCVAIMQECLAGSLVAYGMAPADERVVRAAKIRQLEDLIGYTSNLL
jgi:hypothetical protein